MATLAVTNDFSAGAAIVASEMNTNFSDVETFVNSTPGVLQLTGGTVTGAVTLSNTLTVGQDDTGYDVKLFGATSGTYLLWDESEDNLLLIGGSLGVGTTAPGVLTTISKDLSADTTLLAIDNQNNEHYNTNLDFTVSNGGTTVARIASEYPGSNDVGLSFHTFDGSLTEAMRIDKSGYVGIGTSTPATALSVYTTASVGGITLDGSTYPAITLKGAGTIRGYLGTATANGGLSSSTLAGDIVLRADSGTKLHLGTSSGAAALTVSGTDVGIGTTSPRAALTVKLNTSTDGTPPAGTWAAEVYHASNASTKHGLLVMNNWMASASTIFECGSMNAGNGAYTERFKVDGVGNVAIDGALSKGSGTFDIAHPVKGDDWRLRHSFIEGPRADLIYRGTVTLSGGTATVDLDTASDMTDGTWEALCRDPWAMVASSGNAVEWSLSGKTLTITSDTADAVCNWMVIAERQDDHIRDDSPIADDDGYLIVEYEREASPPPAPPEEAEEAAA